MIKRTVSPVEAGCLIADVITDFLNNCWGLASGAALTENDVPGGADPDTVEARGVVVIAVVAIAVVLRGYPIFTADVVGLKGEIFANA